MKKYIGQGYYVEKNANRFEIFNQAGFVAAFPNENLATIEAEKLKNKSINQKNDIDLARRRFIDSAKKDKKTIEQSKNRLEAKFKQKKKFLNADFVQMLNGGKTAKILDSEYANGGWKYKVQYCALPYNKVVVHERQIVSKISPKYIAYFKSVPNQDILFQGSADDRIAEQNKQLNVFVHGDSLKQLKQKSKEFIQHFDLGGGNWIGAKIFDSSNKLIAEISYNLRVWDRRNGLKSYSKELKDKELS